MRITALSICILALITGTVSAETRNSFISNGLGISLEAPIVKDTNVATYQIAMFFLPTSNNFTASVNIQRQLFAQSIEEYDKLSIGQFKQLNLTVLNHTLKGNDLRYEYKGQMEGRVLHWYSRSIKTGQYIYLITATSLDSDWKQQKQLLMKSVDSFNAKL